LYKPREFPAVLPVGVLGERAHLASPAYFYKYTRKTNSMAENFALPEGLTGRFAVVKLWPAIKTAEDECIARLKIAAISLGLECVEIHANGSLISDPATVISKKNVDFVFHLHYDTPKFYDAFSFVALWNPIQFYHEWGYQRTSRNLITHDDFISCSSPAADDHVGRMVRNHATHLPPLFKLYHSTADIVYPPSLGDFKLFYIGINWEAISGGKSRHQDVLKRLDQSGLVRIYGPQIFQGVKVWAGYDSYVREIPFDGISMLDEISRAGISLVLSSQAHRDSALMSNRLFESVAAGALVICDENNFATKFFGDSLLYIDSRCSDDKIFEDIQTHIAWAKANPEKALAMVAKAQAIFREKFTLKKNLSQLYEGLQDRKAGLLKRQGLDNDAAQIQVAVYLLLPVYSKEILDTHIGSVTAQEYTEFSPVLVVDKAITDQNRAEIAKALADASVPVELMEVDFFNHSVIAKNKYRRKVGAVIAEVLKSTQKVDAVLFVAPNEQLFSNHLQVLAGSLMRNPEANCVATAAIIKCANSPVHSIHERLDFGFLNPAAPNGYARFMFRVSALPADLEIALPYLDRKSLAAMLGENIIRQEVPATVVIDTEQEFPAGLWNEGQENELLGDFSPKAFTVYKGFSPDLPSLRPSAAPPPPPPYSRLSLRWLSHQANELRTHGFSARLKVLKIRLGIQRADHVA
jgi:hypothetical protein